MFRDRADAGRRLSQMLTEYADQRPVVVALPRGGVEVGAEVAAALDAPLEILVVRKLGAPGHEELGIGAIARIPGAPDASAVRVVLDQELIRYLQVPPGYLEAESERQTREIARREELYRGGRPPVPLAGRVVIVVDDGVATGSSTRAALRAAREARPARLILAVPVGAPESLRSLSTEADEVVTLAAPRPFGAVGAFYDNFDQTSDQRVIELLDHAWGRAAGHGEPGP
jgi:putative phosphoribosyl transferase